MYSTSVCLPVRARERVLATSEFCSCSSASACRNFNYVHVTVKPLKKKKIDREINYRGRAATTDRRKDLNRGTIKPGIIGFPDGTVFLPALPRRPAELLLRCHGNRFPSAVSQKAESIDTHVGTTWRTSTSEEIH